jgi:hypothetical protein
MMVRRFSVAPITSWQVSESTGSVLAFALQCDHLISLHSQEDMLIRNYASFCFGSDVEMLSFEWRTPPKN